MSECPLVEPQIIFDTYANSVGGLEILGCCIRATLAVTQTSPDGHKERVIVSKIVMPRAEAAALAKKIQALED